MGRSPRGPTASKVTLTIAGGARKSRSSQGGANRGGQGGGGGFQGSSSLWQVEMEVFE